jgi:excinuclease ABC subunit A
MPRPPRNRFRHELPFVDPTSSAVAWLGVINARHNNLKGIDVYFPLGRFVAVTGVSGSGKSSLVNDILREALSRDLNGAQTTPGDHDRIVGLEHLDKVIDIDQSPIGRTPRSNPATYVKVFDLIRDLYTKLPEAKTRGYKPGRFSFNVSGGRCENCEGNGSIRLDMDFLADVWVKCPVCEGRRFNRETLQIRFKDKNIHEVLDMDLAEAVEHFANVPAIHGILQTLCDVGMDYIKLGQPSPTLSGGEAQRIKLAKELSRKATGRTLYILDEPTTGLHFDDIAKLLQVLQGLVDRGNSVVVIEHNLDVIKTADWVIDLGPEGGGGGGRLIAAGPPEEIAACEASHTGRSLRDFLTPPKRGNRSNAKSRSAAVQEKKLPTHLRVEGAREHNLRDVSLSIPLRQTTVFCGPSGSGKTSLAIDTLYAEGQRRYIESLSSYARQFLGQTQKPRVERVTGLSPAICIEQKSASKSPRSTVGTVTEVYDYFRILFARLGLPHCPTCDLPIGTQTSDEIIDKLMERPDGTKLYVLAPIHRDDTSSYESLWQELARTGFVRMRVDDVSYEISSPPKIDRKRKHKVEVVVDRLTVRPNQRSRLAEAVESALDLGRGVMHVAQVEDGKEEKQWKTDRFSQHFACDKCGRSFEELTPNHFSFNSSIGWCPACEGLGMQAGADSGMLMERPGLSIIEGAISYLPPLNDSDHPLVWMLDRVAEHAGFSLDDPFEELSAAHRRIMFHGTGDEWIALGDDSGMEFQFKGIFPAISEAARVSWVYRNRLSGMLGEVGCSTCHGSRLKDYPSAAKLAGRTMAQWCELPLGECLAAVKSMKLDRTEKQIAGELFREITQRLTFLVDVGLEYLTLGRSTPTLSGGEAQRIRLASQLGSGLTGVLYLLDEPTIGLHPRDNGRLLGALLKLRDLGNTVIIVEHDREVIDAADHVVDFGPGAGRLGGEVTAEGTPSQIKRHAGSLTGRYLAGSEAISVPDERRPVGEERLQVIGAVHNNLQQVDVSIPLGCFVAVTGVSGSGKSSLINDVLWAALARRLHRAQTSPGMHESILGIEHIDKVINVDQQPIGNTPASNPATYTGIFDLVRDLYTQLPESKIRGYSPGWFSFNRPGGRCEACEGSGVKRIEMHFLPDVWVTCDVCMGKRYTPETLAVTFRGKSIAEVLELTAAEALTLFENVPRLRRLLETLRDVGLDYVPLGQSAPTLSGGEAQRLKLAAELARPNTGKTLYVLDEPTTGLHFDDLRKLLRVLHRLVDLGNTVVTIEHNLDVIKTADWVIDMGPEAGEGGGKVVFAGTPEELVASTAAVPTRKGGRKKGTIEPVLSHTAVALAPVLAAGPRAPREVVSSLAEVMAEPPGPIDLGEDVKMPWEIDGRKWHTQQRVSVKGKSTKWDGEALAWLIDEVEKRGVFAPVRWEDRQCVEVTAARKSDGWFLHAMTGEEWLLRLKFRPGRGAFKQEMLSNQLGLGSLDDLKEVPLYGKQSRVRVRKLRSLFQQVDLSVYRLSEIQTDGFRAFLDKAIESFTKAIDKRYDEPSTAEPWTGDGEAWHRGKTGFKPGRSRRWPVELLDRVLESIAQASPAGSFDWKSRDSVKRRLVSIGMAWARLMTKEHLALRLVLVGPKGAFNMAAIDHLASSQKLRTNNQRFDVIELLFADEDSFSAPLVEDFLARHFAEFMSWASKGDADWTLTEMTAS